MKKISTVAVKQNRSFSEQKLTIGFDLGDRSSWYCVLATGSVLLGTEAEHDSESHEGSVRGDAAQPDRVGNGDAFALGQSVGERVGASACSSLLENRLTPPTLLETAMFSATMLWLFRETRSPPSSSSYIGSIASCKENSCCHPQRPASLPSEKGSTFFSFVLPRPNVSDFCYSPS
jgi:hypothetical protein